MIEAKTKTERRRVIMEKRIRDQKGAKTLIGKEEGNENKS